MAPPIAPSRALPAVNIHGASHMKIKSFLQNNHLCLALLCITILVSACTNSGNESDNPAVIEGEFTFVKSFGGVGNDGPADLAVLNDGTIVVAGSLGYQSQNPLQTFYSNEQWLASVSPAGDLNWQTIPHARLINAGTQLFGRKFFHILALADGGGLFLYPTVGADDERNNNVSIIRRAADEQIVWNLHLDSGAWNNPIQLEPGQAYSRDYLFTVLGDELNGWFVIADSYGIVEKPDDNSDVQFFVNARSAVIWFVQPNGEVRWQRRLQAPIDVDNDVFIKGPQVLDAALTDTNDLVMAIDNFNGDSGDVSIVWLDSGNSLRAGADTAQLMVHTQLVPTSDAGTLYAGSREFKDSPAPEVQVIKRDANGVEQWSRSFTEVPSMHNVGEDLSGLYFRAATQTSSGVDRYWLASETNIRGDWMVEILNANGDTTGRCLSHELNRFRNIVSLDAIDNVAMTRLLGIDNESMLIEYVLGSDCTITNTINYGRFQSLAYNTRPIYTAARGNERFQPRRLQLNNAQQDILTTGLLPTQITIDGIGEVLLLSRLQLFDSVSGEALTSLESPLLDGPTYSSGFAPEASRLATNGNTISLLEHFRGSDEFRASLLNVDLSGTLTQRHSTVSPNVALNSSNAFVMDASGNRWFADSGSIREFLFEDCPGLYRVDSTGTIQAYSLAADNTPLQVLNLGSALDGGFYAIGTDNCKRPNQLEDATIRLVHIDPSGNATGQILSRHNDDSFIDILRRNLDSHAIGGETFHSLPVQVPDSSDADSYGLRHHGPLANDNWDFINREPNFNRARLSSAVVAHDGGLALIVNIEMTDATLPLYDATRISRYGEEDFALLKLDRQGRPQWMRIFGGGGNETGYHLRRTSTGYAILARSNSFDAVGPGSNDIWLLHTGRDGHIAASTNGEDACPACLGSVSGPALAAYIAQNFRIRILPALSEPETISFASSSDAFVLDNLPLVQNTVDSNPDYIEVHAQQCLGNATNIQENPIDAETHSVSVAVTGFGRVVSSPFAINCGSTCNADFVADTTIDLDARAGSGYQFSSWGGDCTSALETISLLVNNDKQCSATFVPNNPRTLDLVILGRGTVSENLTGFQCSTPANENQTNCTAEFAEGDTITLLQSAAAGFRWNSWGNCDTNLGENGCVVQMNTSRNIIAEFVANTSAVDLNITVNGNGTITSSPGGINCGSDCSESYPQNTSVVLTPTADLGFFFNGWSGDCTGNGITTVVMDSAKNCSAQFDMIAPNVAILTTSILLDGSPHSGVGVGNIVSEPAGINCGSEGTDCEEGFVRATTVMLATTAEAGFRFQNWSDDCSGSDNPLSLTMNNNINCVAEFVTDSSNMPRLDIVINGSGRVDSNPAGINCGSDCSEVFPFNSAVTLAAAGTPTSTFQSWSGDCSGGDFINIIMNSHKTCTANFAPVTGTARLTMNVIGNGTVITLDGGINCPGDCVEDYLLNAQALISATPGPGTQLQWSGDCAELGNATDFNLTMFADRQCTATFSP